MLNFVFCKNNKTIINPRLPNTSFVNSNIQINGRSTHVNSLYNMTYIQNNSRKLPDITISLRKLITRNLEISHEADTWDYLYRITYVLFNGENYLDKEVDLEFLSDGMKSKFKMILNMATIFTTKKKIIIIDEPEIGLDVTIIPEIARILGDFPTNDRIIIIVTHSDIIERVCDKTIIF